MAGFAIELLVAMYVGYFGAGVGILVLSLLALLGIEDIHAMNGVKVLLVSVVNGVAIVTFVVAGHRLAAGPRHAGRRHTGGYGGAHYAQKMSPQHVRWIVIVVGFGMSSYFFIRH